MATSQSTPFRPAALAGLVLAVGLSLGLGLPLAGHAATACDQAWANYNDMKQRTVMDEAQYPLTFQGQAVREACGASALPVPPGSDVPHRVIVHRRQSAAQPQQSQQSATPAPAQPRPSPAVPIR